MASPTVRGHCDPQVQQSIVLTPHPLQRVGAYAFACLAGWDDPTTLLSGQFAAVTQRMTDDAVRAAKVPDTKADNGFWLKASGSFFPGAKMNHHSRLTRGETAVVEEVRAWRTMPAENTWPAAPCALCGRSAVGFFGKIDVPLGMRVSYRNTTPPGHGGVALCWPCVCCFYALPYGCHLTGGPSTAFHSWDDAFLARLVARQVRANERHLALGVALSGPRQAERIALRQLRGYARPVLGGVELLVFSNNNREQTLSRYGLTEPLAEWLRRTMNDQARQRAYRRLVRVHVTPRSGGEQNLAYQAFRQPERIFFRAAAYLLHREGDPGPAAADLAPLCYSFLIEVMGVRDTDVKLIRGLAVNVATVLAAQADAVGFKKYRVAHREPKRLRAWLEHQAVAWTLAPPRLVGGEPVGVFLSTDQFRLLFEPDGEGWFCRQLLLVAVLEELHHLGWRPVDADEMVDDLAEEDDESDGLDEADLGAGQPPDGNTTDFDTEGSAR